MNDFYIKDDIEIITELLDISLAEIAKQIGVSPVTVSRWMKDDKGISEENIRKLYEYAFEKGIRLNRIKEQLYREDYSKKDYVVLFHGAKTDISGELSLERSKPNHDFGHGFYCGESLEQSAMFVSGFPHSTLYIVGFNKKGLHSVRYKVDRDWMLTVAYFRGKLDEYKDHPLIRGILSQLEGADYIVAPIADNRMFEIIDSYINGEITDLQCQHCLSATNLGMQNVFITERALSNVQLLRHCYLTSAEKQYYIRTKQEETKIGNDKVKVARIQYRNQGQYIEEVLKQ